jgi:hypothetical protein
MNDEEPSLLDLATCTNSDDDNRVTDHRINRKQKLEAAAANPKSIDALNKDFIAAKQLFGQVRSHLAEAIQEFDDGCGYVEAEERETPNARLGRALKCFSNAKKCITTSVQTFDQVAQEITIVTADALARSSDI